jgi:uncharacterized protein YjiS (DUF1127 family)
MTYYSQNCPQTLTEIPAGFTGFLTRMVTQWLQNQRLRSSIRRERTSLASMSAEMLLDIGIDRDAADSEAASMGTPIARQAASID